MFPFSSQYRELTDGQTIYYAWFESMHTRVDVVLCHSAKPECDVLCEWIYNELSRLAGLMNRFDSASELAKINMTAADRPVTTSEDIYKIVRVGIGGYSLTNGLFDITVHSHNHYKEGIAAIEISELDRTIHFTHRDVQIDLGGIAKGYALDVVADYLLHESIGDFMINIGNSSICAHGNQPGGEGWQIALAGGGDNYLLKNQCLSISGNHSNNTKHIVDPSTGKYINATTLSAIITLSGVESEIRSTANAITKCLG